MAKMNLLQVGVYAATGKIVGSLPVKENANVALRAAEEGIVLLKNDGVLPLGPVRAALFGAGSRDTAFCGTGSGYAFSPYTVSVYQGLKNAGFTITSDLWLNNYDKKRKEIEKNDKDLSFLDKRFSGITTYFDVDRISKEELSACRDSDVAFYVIKRNAGEAKDREAIKGDYFLSDNEKENITLLSENFNKVIVILNTCVIDCSWLKENEKISALILLGQAGLEAGNALANIITGKVSPSGRLTDTFALKYEDYPASKTFSANDGNTLQEDYIEDIYVGYRYFDSKKLDVVYPFGYGLSYTEFEYRNIETKADWEKIEVSLNVCNIGKRASKEVVQLYVSAPSGKLKKPYQELKTYAKTALIQAGESERLTLCFDTKDLSSYDEESSSWIMEKGKYLLRLGRDSRNTKVIGAIRLDETAVTEKLSKQFELDRELDLLELESFDTSDYEGEVLELKKKDCVTIDGASKIERTLPVYTTGNYAPAESRYDFKWKTKEEVNTVREIDNATLLDVVDRKITMEEFVASLPDEVLVRLVAGDGQESKIDIAPRLPKGALRSNYNGSTSGKTTDMFCETLGIPACSLADGPAGLHLMGTPSTTFPCGMVLAQTFNEELAYEVGDAYGKEMEAYDIGLCLGPGMNIHRDPLCGRNFEYYSEDPLISGLNAAAFVNGLQKNHPGYGTSIKHFCCNSQENDRPNSNASVSERALREIYLKGFEIAVKKSQPLTVMSSYNLLNGIHTSSRYDLLTDVLRGEWGFKGFVMTDWDGASDRICDLQAGNDILMGGYSPDLLMAGVGSVPPQFEEDGTVSQKEVSMYGYMKKKADCYNSFVPDKDGDTSIVVEYKGEVNEKLKELQKQGLVEINEEENKVIYKGYDHSHSLKRSVLQRNVMRILNYLAYGAPMALARRK